MYNVALVPAEYRADRVDTDEATTCHSCSKWYHTPFRFLGKSLALSINALRSQQAKCLFFHLPTHCMLGMLTMFQAIKTGINPAFILGFHSSQSSQEPPEVMYFGNRILQFTNSFCCSRAVIESPVEHSVTALNEVMLLEQLGKSVWMIWHFFQSPVTVGIYCNCCELQNLTHLIVDETPSFANLLFQA